MDYQSEVSGTFRFNVLEPNNHIESTILSPDLLVSAADLTSRKLLKSIHQILLLRLSHTEFVCLKTLILYRPGELKRATFYQYSEWAVGVAYSIYVLCTRRTRSTTSTDFW